MTFGMGDAETGGTRGQGDKGTRGQGDKETRRQGDKETRRQGDKETRGQGDKGTRRQGDKETRGKNKYQLSTVNCPLSTNSKLFLPFYNKDIICCDLYI